MSALNPERDASLRSLEHEIGRLLRRIRRGMADRAAQVDPGLSASAYPLLITLAELGPQRAADLADLFALDKGGVSRLVHQLMALDLVQRDPDPQDGRASILRVTAHARQRLSSMAEQRHAAVGERLAEWEPEAIADLAGGLARFNAAIAEA